MAGFHDGRHARRCYVPSCARDPSPVVLGSWPDWVMMTRTIWRRRVRLHMCARARRCRPEDGFPLTRLDTNAGDRRRQGAIQTDRPSRPGGTPRCARRLTNDSPSSTPQRALYIDFEGRKDHPPVLLGATRYRSAERVHQYVTDPRYIPVGSRDELEVLTFLEAVERILQRAEAHDRLIVAWTTHELDLVERLGAGASRAIHGSVPQCADDREVLAQCTPRRRQARLRQPGQLHGPDQVRRTRARRP